MFICKIPSHIIFAGFLHVKYHHLIIFFAR
jgi:hypothetical protein